MTIAVPIAALALAAALLVRRTQPPSSTGAGWFKLLTTAAMLAPLAAFVAWPEFLTPARSALAAALALALLARDPRDIPQTECAIKLAWVLGAAFALSWAGDSLLSLAAGSARAREQWPALALGLDPYALWSAALALSLLVGVVLLGGAPFHFWPADLVHGGRAHLAPLVIAVLQAAGAMWLVHRLDGIDAFPAADHLARALLVIASALALIGGAATLGSQRRPERRVGTLASLHGALALAALAADSTQVPFSEHGGIGAWAAHLALAGTGAALFARMLPVGSSAAAAPAVLFRRHPWSGTFAGYALLSLAGAPGTPGMVLWLDTARVLARERHAGLLLALVVAWVAAFAVAAGELRRAYGSPAATPLPARPVPGPARAALWLVATGLVAMVVAWRSALRP